MTLKSFMSSALALTFCAAAPTIQAQDNSLMASAPYFFYGGQLDGANEFPTDMTCVAYNATRNTINVKLEVRTFRSRANRGDVSDSDTRVRAFALGPKRVGLMRSKVESSTASSAQCQVIHDGPLDSIVASFVVEDGADGRGSIAGPIEYVRATSRPIR